MTNLKPSKSARKREYTALQALGEELISLTREQLAGIHLDETLLDAVLTAKSINSHGALRRQKQLIGKLMRHQDPLPIQAALQTLGGNELREKDIFRRAERWRDRIAIDGSAALRDLFAELGHENQDLVENCRSLELATNDKIRREILRKIFREIHRELSAKMQNSSV
ncbi:MAG: ribosome-associated protein [Woeseiaceae bacterium]|jgi:ribosome-associated protein